MKKAILFIGLIIISVGVFAQKVEVNKSCQAAYDAVISLNFKQAGKIIAKEKDENPQNLFPLYLENYIDFLKAFIGESENDYQRLKEKKTERINALENLSDTNPYRDYLISNIRLQYAMAASKFGDYFSSAWDIRRSFLLIKDNTERFPDFQPQYITLGVLHILIGMIPDKYDWILSLISLEGTVEEGMQELEKALNQSGKNREMAYLKPEILFYLGFTEMNLGLDPQNKKELLEALKPYAESNLLLLFLQTDMLMRMGKNDEALKLLQTREHFSEYYPFYYLSYLKGEAYLRKLDDHSRQAFEVFLENFEGKNYLKDACRKIAWSYLLQDDTLHYRQNMKQVLNVGDDFVGVDKEAEKEAETGKIPNVSLLKARLLFDGGYYAQSWDILQSIDVKLLLPDEVLERLYRLGRVAQKMNRDSLAIQYFQQTIEKGRSSKRYFAGNAALQLGRIFEQKGETTQALKYYEICRTLDFDEYETSIKEKAKQGIKRIEAKQ